VLRQDKLNPCLIAIESARQLPTTPSLATGAGRKNMSLILRKNYREGAAFGLKRLLKKMGMAQSILLSGKITNEVAPGARRRNRGRLVAP
jgi:hypothetical protein